MSSAIFLYLSFSVGIGSRVLGTEKVGIKLSDLCDVGIEVFLYSIYPRQLTRSSSICTLFDESDLIVDQLFQRDRGKTPVDLLASHEVYGIRHDLAKSPNRLSGLLVYGLLGHGLGIRKVAEKITYQSCVPETYRAFLQEGPKVKIKGSKTIYVRFIQGSIPLEELPPRAVALDGAVRGPQQGPDDRWSFDHHDNCIRLITLATCQQVLVAIDLGFDTATREFCVNDLDGDTVLSLFVAAWPDMVETAYGRDLVDVVGRIDAHGPAAEAILSTTECRIADQFYYWAIKEITDLRPEQIQEKFKEWPEILMRCFERILAVIEGRGHTPETKEAELVIEKASTDSFMVMGRCDDFRGFGQAYQEGHHVVALYTEAAEGSYKYTIAKLSDLVPYELGPGNKPGTLLYRLNMVEPGWGGGSSIGGSPRLEGGVSSHLLPDQIWETMQE
jgi:hypothetical protein